MKKNGERCIFSKFPWKMHVNRQFFDRESPVKGCVCFITDSEEVIISTDKTRTKN